MVVAALFNQYGGSNRGLARREISASAINASDWSDAFMPSSQSSILTEAPSHNMNSQITVVPAATKPKRKRCRASKFLASVAADLDLFTDWFFLYHTITIDREYREEYAQNPVEGKAEYLVPPFLIWTVLVVCILGTLMWLILATDGAIITPFLRFLGVGKISMGLILFFSVIVEDIPQVILTFLIEDYFEDENELNNFALISVIASLYDTLIKLAEAYDERGDMVETGIWCKESLWAHKKSVTGIVSIPIEDEQKSELSIMGSSLSRVHIRKEIPNKRLSVLEKARHVVTETKLPRLMFLSVSLDGTIRLWDTDAKVPGHRRDKCIRTIRGHTKGVTCLAFLGDLQHPRKRIETTSNNHDENLYFLTGSRDGTAKLWNLMGTCKTTYSLTEENGTAITSISYVNKQKTFVCGHSNGNVRCWMLSTGVCLSKYEGHSLAINSLCSLEDSHSFLSASDDSTIRLWDTSTDSDFINKISLKTFKGHSGPVLALCCVDSEIVLSGSVDKTARLWSIENGACLRVFAGHTDSVTSVRSIDQVTFMTGSDDTTIKIWDAFTTGCIRTYTGHKKGVTDVCVPSQEGTFVSCSKDQTIKLWVFTDVVPPSFEDDVSTG